MASLFFQLHVLGAIATVIGLVLAMRQLLFAKDNYKIYVVVLGACGLFQAASGVGLVLSQPGISLGRLCVSGIIYLVAVGSVEIALLRRLQTEPVRLKNSN